MTIAHETLKPLLENLSLSSSDSDLEFFKAGGNNIIYRLKTYENVFALKKYKINPGDPRDRLGAECDFLAVVNAHASDAPVPKLFASDQKAGIGLFSFIEGRKLLPDEIQTMHINQVVDFISMLNAPSLRVQAGTLGNASESRFSVQGHLDGLVTRLERLKAIPAQSDAWRELVRALENTVGNLRFSGLDLVEELSRVEQILSPSDFGFHNVLADENGHLTFIDFEYAGWDDPAKCVSDFFFQPEIPVEEKYYNIVMQACLSHIPQAGRARHERRINFLRPVFGLRWCCIVLNIFDPSWLARQERPYAPEDLEVLRANRFNTAVQLLSKVKGML